MRRFDRTRLNTFWKETFGPGHLSGQSRFVPPGLAILVGLYGLKHFFPVLTQVRTIRSYLETLGPAEDFAHLPPIFHIPGGIPETAIGLVQILMSLGLLLRSRFAWVITVLMTGLSIADLLRMGQVAPVPLLMNCLLAILLLGTRRFFDRSSLTTGTFFSLLSILLLGGYSVFGAFMLGKGFAPPIHSLVTAFYFSVVTMATVGYGDIVPKTDDARMFVVSLILFGITVFSAAISSVLIPLVNDRLKRILLQEKAPMPRQNHYILIGTSTLARNVYHELVARGLPVTVVVRHEIRDPPFDGADQVTGDPADGEVLIRAGAKDALAVLCLLEEDAENAFVVLAAREIGSRARTVVSVRDRVNFSRIRSVSPDMILSPEMIGGELIAMALNNEKIDGEAFFKKVLFLDKKMTPNPETPPAP